MGSVPPISGSSNVQGPGSNPNPQEPANVVQDMLGLWLILQGNVEYGNDNNGGNCTTGQMMAKYIADLVKTIQAEKSPSLADQVLLQHLTAEFNIGGTTTSLATLAQSIASAASSGTVDTGDIATLIAGLQTKNSPGALLISQVTNTSDSEYWFNTANTNASYTWSGDNASMDRILAFISEFNSNASTQFIDGMEDPNSSLPDQLADAQSYAQMVMNLYNSLPANNPFTGVIDDYMNTLVPGQGSTTLLDLMKTFDSGTTPTQAQLTEFLAVLEPGGGDGQNNGFQAIFGSILKELTDGGAGMFTNSGPFTS